MIGRIKSIFYKYHINEQIIGHPFFYLENKNYIYGCVGTTSPKPEFDCFETPKFSNYPKNQFFSKKGLLIQKENPIIGINHWQKINEIEEKKFKEYMYDYMLKNPDEFKYLNLNTNEYSELDKELLFNMWFDTFSKTL